MTAFDAFGEALDLTRTLTAAHYYGVYPAVVCDNQDPDAQGRVLVRLPWSPDAGDGAYEVWARVATIMAGAGRGTWFIPEVGDEVLVGFQGGDPRWPYVIGALWNGKDDPPESMDADNNIRSIVSRSGIRITLDDTEDAVALTLETPGGHRLSMADAGSQITIEDSNGNSCELAPEGITISTDKKLIINAGTAEIHIGEVTVNSGTWNYSGTVSCETAIAATVIASTYMTGTGSLL
jgi:uncharacterized protein involved in type VI secretion and phage assembly